MSKLSFLKFNHSFSWKATSPRKNDPNPPEKKSFTSRQTSNNSGGGGQSLKPKAEEMKWVFQKFDTNRDGKISVEEYKAAARALDKGSGEAEAVKAFRAMDSDGDGFIDYKEFMEMFSGGGNAGKVREAEMKSAFEVFDLNGDGKISAQELSQIMKRLGETSTLAACRNMVKAFDGNGDGFIDFNEFMAMMITGNKLA